MNKVNAARRFGATQLMVMDRGGLPKFETFANLESFLSPNDLLVMNLSGTIPASIAVRKQTGEEPFEIRLAAFAGSSLNNLRKWWAISLGAGDWRLPTEERGQSPELKVGDILVASPHLEMEVLSVDPQQGRLLKLFFSNEDFLSELYRMAQPIQYSYQEKTLDLWDVQTPLAQIPISVEAPSALFPFSWEQLLRLKEKFRVEFLYHGAGISSTGDPVLDERLPLPEFYSIPKATVRAWQETRAKGGRVIAIGTSVARALESAKTIGEGQPRLLEGVTTLRVRQDCTMDRVDGMLTGYHDPLTSHFDLESAFVGEGKLRTAFESARAKGFRKHEFGDATLLLSR
ncbi:MAG: S-adenosylmethionine:tRNA ribosyltransferase-isomerase [Bdellovibrionota bacterium]